MTIARQAVYAPIQQLLTVIFLVLVTASWTPLRAQDGQDADALYSPEQLEQLVAPIALHPDALLSQMLMASTYPLEIVEAARWLKANPGLKGDALEVAMEAQSWDPSVKSLTAFPQAIEMLNAKLDWTQELGNAFLAQQEDVLDAVQRLRAKADAAETLTTTEQQKVTKTVVKTESGKSQQVIVIEQSDPKVIYIPAYDPRVVYGAWAYPAYPPYYWYPPGYVASRALWFASGVAVGSALWGGCNWGRGSVNINVNRYNSFHRTNITSNNWTHNPKHRRAVPYKGRDVNQRYAKGKIDSQSREAFRGRAEKGRKDLESRRSGIGDKGPGAGARPGIGDKGPGAGARPGIGDKGPGAGARPSIGDRKPTPSQRPAKPQVSDRAKPAASPKKAASPSPSPRAAAYKGVGEGKKVREHSSRGKASRSANRARPSKGGRGGGGRR